MTRYRWYWPEPQPELVATLARSCGLLEVTARVLVTRGFTRPEAVEAFLRDQDDPSLDPFQLAGMEAAVARLQEALRRGESIAVYGDYDVDGQSGTALMVAFLRRLGARVSYYVPHRLQEGYGLHLPALRRLRERQVDLVVTVDCGISALEAAQGAAEMGLDLIITDHHQVPPQLPPARAVVNPHRSDCAYPFKELAGVGVAFKLAQALWQSLGCPPEADPNGFLDLVALGTVADVMPLLGENRTLVRRGLERLNQAPRLGLSALRETAGLKGELGAGHVAYMLAPRLNAGGRLQDATAGVRLLLTEAPTEARELAGELERLNRVRQSLEAFILQQARQQVEGSGNDLQDVPALVVAGEGWHPGVIGIVASRLVDLYYRPTLVIGVEGEWAKGSGRSAGGLHLFAALSRLGDLFESFGGHASAAGFTLAAARVQELRERFPQVALEELRPLLATGQMLPEVRIDAEVRLEELTEPVVAELERLGPFGAGNPSPVLGHRWLQVETLRKVGSGEQHLQLVLRQPGDEEGVKAVGFGMGSLADELRVGGWVQVAFQPQWEEWQGRRQLNLRIRSLEATAPPARPPIRLDGIEALAASRRQVAAGGSGYLDDSLPRGLRVEDRREGRPGYASSVVRRMLLAEELSHQRGPTLLVVLDEEERRQALRVAGEGWVRVEALARDQLPPQALDRFRRDEEGAGEWQVVLACLPPGPGYLAPLWQEATAAGVSLCLHLLFGQADVQRTARLLQSFYPRREELARCYRIWRQVFDARAASGCAAPEAPIAGSVSRLPGVLRERAWRIFREMGLVEGEGAESRFRPLPAGQKLDLTSSPTFREGAAVWAGFESWKVRAIEGHPDEVARWLVQAS